MALFCLLSRASKQKIDLLVSVRSEVKFSIYTIVLLVKTGIAVAAAMPSCDTLSDSYGVTKLSLQ